MLLLQKPLARLLMFFLLLLLLTLDVALLGDHELVVAFDVAHMCLVPFSNLFSEILVKVAFFLLCSHLGLFFLLLEELGLVLNQRIPLVWLGHCPARPRCDSNCASACVALLRAPEAAFSLFTLETRFCNLCLQRKNVSQRWVRVRTLGALRTRRLGVPGRGLVSRSCAAEGAC